ncbi:hypothetical protein ONZ45_g4947 [Pleurotus djamor]|nr:hypothetical protein ONZ45_g4947 [Pleurotus djamor]
MDLPATAVIHSDADKDDVTREFNSRDVDLISQNAEMTPPAAVSANSIEGASVQTSSDKHDDDQSDSADGSESDDEDEDMNSDSDDGPKLPGGFRRRAPPDPTASRGSKSTRGKRKQTTTVVHPSATKKASDKQKEIKADTVKKTSTK